MSVRRSLGDKVWVRRGAGFGLSSGEWAEIMPEKAYKAVAPDHTLPCPYECGDDGCRQWPRLQVDGGTMILQYVTECEMYDDIPYHKGRRQHGSSRGT